MVGRRMTEAKVIDTVQTSTTFVAAGSIVTINGCATGTDFTSRIGRKIKMTSVQMRGVISPGTLDNICRIIIFYDCQPNGGGAPSVADVLLNHSGGGGSTATDFMNLNNRDRFKVLKDMTVPVARLSTTATQAVAGSPTQHVVNIYQKLNHEVIYNSTGATAAEIATGLMGVLFISTAAGSSGCTWSSRIRFIDA